jgi:lauroyl/myristoyl acyltransferase
LVAGRDEFSEDVDEVDRTDFAAALNDLRQSGRSVLLVGAHVGLFQLGASAVRSTVGANRLGIGVGPPTRESFMSVRNDPERALYVLVRSLKQPGMVGSIAGDGPWGKSAYRTRFLGREITFALGAPFVIYHAKCQPIWHVTGWKNGGIRTSFALGPTHASREPYDAWVPRWFEFYVAGWRRSRGAIRETFGDGRGI